MSKPNQNNKGNRQSVAAKNYWKRQKCLEDLSKYAEGHASDLYRNQWEYTADKKNFYSRVRWEVDKVTAEMNEDLEKRRNRLLKRLKEEEALYLEEISLGSREDPEVKHQKLLQRYNQLKTQKEMEREQIVNMKKEQQFKQNCDELRSLICKKHQKEIAAEGEQMILEKMEEAKRVVRENELYNELWRKDCEAKKDKEEKAKEEQRRLDSMYAEYVTDQIKAKKLEKIKKLGEKEIEADIMAEQKRLNELEEECYREMKKKKQMEMKNNLDNCTRMNLKLKAQKIQEDLGQDIFFLKRIMNDEDKKQKSSKKKALLKEQNDYLRYLKSQMRKEEEFEKEVDLLYQKELDEIWKKKEKEWDEEKQKRRQLEKKVTDGVRDQINEKMEKYKEIQLMNQSFAEKILQEDEENKKRDIETLKLIRERNEKYQQEILNQIKLKEERIKEEKKQEAEELKEIEQSRREEEIRIQKLISELKIGNEHPYRVCRREIFNQCN